MYASSGPRAMEYLGHITGSPQTGYKCQPEILQLITDNRNYEHTPMLTEGNNNRFSLNMCPKSCLSIYKISLYAMSCGDLNLKFDLFPVLVKSISIQSSRFTTKKKLKSVFFSTSEHQLKFSWSSAEVEFKFSHANEFLFNCCMNARKVKERLIQLCGGCWI